MCWYSLSHLSPFREPSRLRDGWLCVTEVLLAAGKLLPPRASSAHHLTAVSMLQGARIWIHSFDGSGCRWPWNNRAVFSESCKWSCLLAYNLVTASEASYHWGINCNRTFSYTEITALHLFIQHIFIEYLLMPSAEWCLGIRGTVVSNYRHLFL